MTTKKYSVDGMSCAACQAAVERCVSALDGVLSVSVSLLSNSMVVSFDESNLSDDVIIKAVSDAGYGASIWVKKQNSSEDEEKKYRGMKRRLIFSAVFAVVMMYVTMGHMVGLPLPGFMSPSGHSYEPIVYAAVQLVLTIPVITVNRSFFIDGFKAVKNGSANMNTLIATGAAASMFYGIYILVRMIVRFASGAEIHHFSHDLYFESVTMILTLILLGRALEFRARRHTSDAVRKLMELTPKTAEVRRDGEIVTIPSDELLIDDVVIVRAGSSSPCDGVVISGGGAADESVITGESVPVQKDMGSTIICGTILTSGYAEIRATHVGEDTTVAKITQLVEDASSSKAPVQKLADKISRVFVPIVCAIALLTFVLWLVFTHSLHQAVGFGISVLVISCPCALGLATPTAVMVGIGRGAGLGILIKSADALDTLHKCSVAVLDKTGTITEGKMSVADVHVADEFSTEDAISLAASVETSSEHPIGRAIASYAESLGVPLLECEDFSQTFGGGVRAVIGGRRVYGGNLEFIRSSGTTVSEEIDDIVGKYAAEGKTPVTFVCDGAVMCTLAVADTIKESSKAAVEMLKEGGFEVVMLTGDCEATARAIAGEAGISHVISGVKPDEKANAIETIMTGEFFGDTTRRYAVMIGDGVNDAPALAKSDCGIAVARGTDIAIESASVVLVKSDLTDAARAVRLSHAVMRNISENLAWAFGYNILCIPIAAGVLFPAFGIALTPMISALAMSLSSVCVVSNALRLRAFKA